MPTETIFNIPTDKEILDWAASQGLTDISIQTLPGAEFDGHFDLLSFKNKYGIEFLEKLTRDLLTKSFENLTDNATQKPAISKPEILPGSAKHIRTEYELVNGKVVKIFAYQIGDDFYKGAANSKPKKIKPAKPETNTTNTDNADNTDNATILDESTNDNDIAYLVIPDPIYSYISSKDRQSLTSALDALELGLSDKFKIWRVAEINRSEQIVRLYDAINHAEAFLTGDDIWQFINTVPTYQEFQEMFC